MKQSTVATQLSDDRLIAETKRLAAEERSATAALIRALMEVDARKLYLREGSASMFTYCTRVLHLAEGAAYNRIEAVRTAARFPQVLDALLSGELNLTTVRMLSPHLTIENVEQLIAGARYKSKRDVELHIATLYPRPTAPTVIRKLPAARQPAVETQPPMSSAPDTVADSETTPARPPLLQSPSLSRPVVQPLAPERYKIQFTVTRETHDKLRRAQDLLRHAIPDGDPAAIFDRAVTLLIEDVERRKLAGVAKPRANSSTSSATSRHIPAAIRREVWKRDEGRCAFVGREGRCGETGFLEFHHVEPFAAGGATTVGNLELRCRGHNAYEARLFFGPDLAREQPDSFRNELEAPAPREAIAADAARFPQHPSSGSATCPVWSRGRGGQARSPHQAVAARAVVACADLHSNRTAPVTHAQHRFTIRLRRDL